jgi:hypothetical protein
MVVNVIYSTLECRRSEADLDTVDEDLREILPCDHNQRVKDRPPERFEAATKGGGEGRSAPVRTMTDER